jgi:cellulose synthase/poly-beta-1,6-N-acetylglucosamine synthase-like glycosyltransferase
MWLLYPLMVLLVMYCVLIVWYRRAWVDLPENIHTLDKSPCQTFVTVIIPARNEAGRIEQCLQSLLQQDYPKHLLQVLIMDDASEDDTASIAACYARKHAFIEVKSVQHHASIKAHKKNAIEQGIQLAKGTLIVASDADCIHPTAWISTLVKSHELDQKKFIAAPVMFFTKPTVLSVFQTLDFLSLQGITGASVHRNFHTMCNGANIAYSKKAFEEVRGFEGIDQLPTGDDMLLMHKIYKRHPEDITWLKNKNALVLTDEAVSWKQFFQQRIRWASKAAYYDDKRIFYVLLLVYVFNVGLFITGIASFFSWQIFMGFLLVLGIKTMTELYFLIPVARFFSKQKWLWYFPLMQPLHIVYTVIAGWLGKFGSYEWKGRRVG